MQTFKDAKHAQLRYEARTFFSPFLVPSGEKHSNNDDQQPENFCLNSSGRLPLVIFSEFWEYTSKSKKSLFVTLMSFSMVVPSALELGGVLLGEAGLAELEL